MPARFRIARGRLPLAVAALLLAATSPIAHAQVDGPDFYKVRNIAAGGSLSLRAEPSATSARLARIPAGATCLRRTGCRGGLTFREFTTLGEAQKAQRMRENPRWCKVDYKGTVGWVAGRYLAEDGCTAPVAPPATR